MMPHRSAHAPPSSVHVLPAAEPLIALRGVSVRFGGKEVVSHIDLTVAPGEIVTLIGPNGAGKTTLVRTMLGLLRPAEGQVHRRPGLRIGYVPQRVVVEPIMPLSVRRLMTLTRSSPPAEIRRRLEAVGTAHLIDRAVHDLSGGEMQRVLLARALLRDPHLLVLDEPAQNVDVVGQDELYELIGQIRRDQGCGILLISHDLHVVMAATDRVICLNHHVCCSGRPEDVSRHPDYLALFGERGARTLAIYPHDHHHEHDLSGEVIPLPAEPPKRHRD